MKTITMNYKTFELVKVRHLVEPSCRFRTLGNCYKNYSDAKRNIFNRWCKWFDECDNAINNGVARYNCTMFTIGGYIYNIPTPIGLIEGSIYITPSHNYLNILDIDYEKLVKYMKQNKLDNFVAF